MKSNSRRHRRGPAQGRIQERTAAEESPPINRRDRRRVDEHRSAAGAHVSRKDAIVELVSRDVSGEFKRGVGVGSHCRIVTNPAATKCVLGSGDFEIARARIGLTCAIGVGHARNLAVDECISVAAHRHADFSRGADGEPLEELKVGKHAAIAGNGEEQLKSRCRSARSDASTLPYDGWSARADEMGATLCPSEGRIQAGG